MFKSSSFFFGSALAGAMLALISCGTNEPVDEATVQDFSRNQITGRGADSSGRSLPNKTLALTFDDGLSSISLPLAQYLANQGIETAFFLNGANGRVGDMDKIRKMNHLIANHTHNHKDMQKSTTQKLSQVVQTDNIIKPYVLGNAFLFRAPFGSWNGNVADYLNSQGLRKYVGSVFWDVGGALANGYAADWACWSKGIGPKSCGDMYLNEIAARGNRGIVLMHDSTQNTFDMVKYIVPILKSRGFKFVRVDTVPTVAEQVRKAGGTPGVKYQ